jgi:hypothetical protein
MVALASDDVKIEEGRGTRNLGGIKFSHCVGEMKMRDRRSLA